MELPPRARRIPTTATKSSRKTGNYLRVRGEYMISKGLKFAQEELPPRARRILEGFTDVVNAGGTTSACAENTLIASLISLRIWNYLRVRGEYTPHFSG